MCLNFSSKLFESTTKQSMLFCFRISLMNASLYKFFLFSFLGKKKIPDLESACLNSQIAFKSFMSCFK